MPLRQARALRWSQERETPWTQVGQDLRCHRGGTVQSPQETSSAEQETSRFQTIIAVNGTCTIVWPRMKVLKRPEPGLGLGLGGGQGLGHKMGSSTQQPPPPVVAPPVPCHTPAGRSQDSFLQDSLTGMFVNTQPLPDGTLALK